MDLKRLKTFVTIANKGTVLAAGQSLRITQPALSRQLRELEAELGTALFSRVGRRLQLTAEGAALLPECQALLRNAEALVESGRALTQGDRGVLRVGATPQVIANFFPSIIQKFSAKLPFVRLQLIEGGGLDHIKALRNGELHAAITIPGADESSFATFALPPIKLLVASRRRSGLEAVDRVELDQLKAEPLLLLSPSFGTRKVFDAACRLSRFIPNIYLESGSPETLLSFARAGLGYAIVPNSALIHTKNLALAWLTFRNKQLDMPLGILWSNEHPRPRFADDFNELTATQMKLIATKFEEAL